MEYSPSIFFLWGRGGGGPTTKKIMPPVKTQDVLCLFCSFLKYVQNRRFCAKFGQKCGHFFSHKNVDTFFHKKEQKRSRFLSFLIFFVLFCSFCRNSFYKKEQKRSCRRENRKMSFVFFVVGSPLLCRPWQFKDVQSRYL